jgi:hypothetical protein
MGELSAAQKVLDAANAAYDAAATVREGTAATLQAAAVYLLKEKGWSLGVRWSAEELQQIARELEGQE